MLGFGAVVVYDVVAVDDAVVVAAVAVDDGVVVVVEGDVVVACNFRIFREIKIYFVLEIMNSLNHGLLLNRRNREA